MSEFSFPAGELARQIARRGLSQREFAARAQLSKNTIVVANQGGALSAKTWGKILIALGAIPLPEIPAGMAEKAVS